MGREQALKRLRDYLLADDKLARIELLREVSGDHQYLPISLAEDLLSLELDVEEKAAIVDCAGSHDNLALEDFLTRNLAKWPQDLATRALRNWNERTHHLLWHRLLPLASQAHVPQRVRYTVLDYCWNSGGNRILEAFMGSDGLEELSDTFHALLFERSMQWNYKNDRATEQAIKVVLSLSRHPYPEVKSLASAVLYLAKFEPKELGKVAHHADASLSWSHFIQLAQREAAFGKKNVEALDKFIAKPPKKDVVQRFTEIWPSVTVRHYFEEERLLRILALFRDQTQGSDFVTNGNFAGLRQDVVLKTLARLSEQDFSAGYRALSGYVQFPEPDSLLTELQDRIRSAKDPGALLNDLPLRIRLRLTETEGKGQKSNFGRARDEETQFLQTGRDQPSAVFCDYNLQEASKASDPLGEDLFELRARKNFFQLAYAGDTKIAVGDGQSYWDLLCDAWLKPTEKKLAPLAESARQRTGVSKLCYINTLGRFVGIDQAALKLLDFIRSDQEDVLRGVIQALGGIGTPRANQELISAITRPNVSQALQMEICQILAHKDVENLQKELRSAISDLSINPDVEDEHWELRDALTNLLIIRNEEPTVGSDSISQVPRGGIGKAQDEVDLNAMLSGKVPNFRQLSSEVKRALRTSQFFHLQVEASLDVDSIDLSPVIDMQYKALELLFRELFEDSASRLINAGILQRKLDVIGYARPVPRAMDEFENYINSLPRIKTIPFFSKFKLRKMLRAICQFRPGKRFTLDGLKAFALFFLCFGRSSCRYGLQGLFELGFASDDELYDFVKTLHVMQDFRNRAAHEGFHPDASNDINGIWQSTAEIVQGAFKVKEAIGGTYRTQAVQPANPKPKVAPIIERKVS